MSHAVACCLVTAIGSLSTDAVITSLRSLGTRVVGCSIYPDNWTAASKELDAFYQVPKATEEAAYVQALLKTCAAEGVTHLVPLTDVEIDALELHRPAFAARGIVLCMQDMIANRICRDKLAVFEAFSADTCVATIPTQTFEKTIPTSIFPLIAKPRGGRSSEGLFVLDDASDFSHYASKLRGESYVVQPRMSGEIYVTDMVRQRSSGKYVTVTRRELTRTANGAGLTVEIQPPGPIDAMAAHIAVRLDLNGCVNIEFLVNNDAAYLMDINPRFSAGVAFSRLAGYDMVTNHFRCFTGERLDETITPHAIIYTRRYVEVST